MERRFVKITELEISGIKLIVPRRFDDSRGVFSEVYNSEQFKSAGIADTFVQDNLSVSAQIGTIRGLHYQTPPYAQSKLIRVGYGRILDVAVDLRRSSPTYGKYVAVELSRESWAQLYIPAGFAHGFCTLEPNTEVIYKVSSVYAPRSEAGILWSDPDLAIAWPIEPHNAVVSEKDSHLPLFKDIVPPAD
jgi:dTDP-4-dehydrorhamnose 3,5-epimerase